MTTNDHIFIFLQQLFPIEYCINFAALKKKVTKRNKS